MPDYEKMYKKAFNALTDAEARIAVAERRLSEAVAIIWEAQLECEEIYIATTEDSPCQE